MKVGDRIRVTSHFEEPREGTITKIVKAKPGTRGNGWVESPILDRVIAKLEGGHNE